MHSSCPAGTSKRTTWASGVGEVGQPATRPCRPCPRGERRGDGWVTGSASGLGPFRLAGGAPRRPRAARGRAWRQCQVAWGEGAWGEGSQLATLALGSGWRSSRWRSSSCSTDSLLSCWPRLKLATSSSTSASRSGKWSEKGLGTKGGGWAGGWGGWGVRSCMALATSKRWAAKGRWEERRWVVALRLVGLGLGAGARQGLVLDGVAALQRRSPDLVHRELLGDGLHKHAELDHALLLLVLQPVGDGPRPLTKHVQPPGKSLPMPLQISHGGLLAWRQRWWRSISCPRGHTISWRLFPAATACQGAKFVCQGRISGPGRCISLVPFSQFVSGWSVPRGGVGEKVGGEFDLFCLSSMFC